MLLQRRLAAAGIRSPSRRDLNEVTALILVAAWGACLAWLLACGIAYFARSGVIPVSTFFGEPYSFKGIEKLFYAAFYVLGACSAFVCTFSGRSLFRNPVAAGIGALLFVPCAAQLAEVAIYGGPLAFRLALPPLDPARWSAFAAAVVPLAYWMALPPMALLGSFVVDKSWISSRRRERSPASMAPRPRAGHTTAVESIWLAGSILLLAACLFPRDLETAAARISYNPHIVSFYIAPALFLWGHRLIPGVDYFPQYGIGIGYFFSFLLRSTARATVGNAVLATAFLSWVYFGSALLVLRRLYASRAYALLVTLGALILTFHTSMSPDGIYLDPSAWPARYPFLFLFVWLYVRAVDSSRRGLDLFLAGAAAGLCIFWNTETGIYALASAASATLLMNVPLRARAVHCAATLSGAAAAFFALSLLAYGPGVLQREFIVGLIKPMTIYASGYGSVPIVWQSPFNLLYAVLSPLIGIATIGWSAAVLWRGDVPNGNRTYVTLFVLSMLGCGLMIKWMNMSFDALWHVNALPMLAVMTWWIQTGLGALARRTADGPLRHAAGLAGAAVLLAVVAFLGLVHDDRNPAAYAARAFMIFPSFLVSSIAPPKPLKWDAGDEAAPLDIALIERSTKPGERVMILGAKDWVYLLAAKRPPAMPWLPSPTIVAFPFLLQSAFTGTEPIFSEGPIEHAALPEPLASLARNRIHDLYRASSSGKALELYRLRDQGESGTPSWIQGSVRR